MQDETVVRVHQIVDFVLLQTDESFEVGAVAAGAVQAVYDVLLLLLLDEQHVEHLLLALAAVVAGLVLGAAVEAHLHPFRAHVLLHHLRVAQRLHQRAPVGQNPHTAVS